MTDDCTPYSTDGAPPSAEEYQRLLYAVSDLTKQMKSSQQQVADLKSQIGSSEQNLRDDMAQERRRRELLESDLRKDIQLTGSNSGSSMGRKRPMGAETISGLTIDEESPKPRRGRRTVVGGIGLKTSDLHPKRRSVTFAGAAFNTSNLIDSSDEEDDIYGNNGPAGDSPGQRKDDDDDGEGCAIELLPNDTFSFLATAKPKSLSLFISVFVIGFQILTLTVLFIDSKGEEEGNTFGFPTGINQSTATIQVVALLIICFGQTDLHDSLNALFVGYQEFELSKTLGRPIKLWRWTLSMCARIAITLFALVVTFIMICTESDTTQVLLDFTSIEFITNLDNIAFWLTAYGYLGPGAQREACLLVNANPSRIVLKETAVNGRKMTRALSVRSASTDLGIAPKRRRRFPRLCFTMGLFVLMLGGWGLIFYWIRNGQFQCQTIFVQFSDDFNPDLAPFSGMYDIGLASCEDGFTGCLRSHYSERAYGNYSQTALFAYCIEETTWSFSFGDEPGDVANGAVDTCEWKARSRQINTKTQDSYDIMSTASEDPWQVVNSRGALVPFTSFELRCFDCRYDSKFCGGEERGECVNNECVCKEGLYGNRCQFYEPCEKIEFTDPLLTVVDDRRFATQYDLLYKDDGSRVEINSRPVYVGNIDGEVTGPGNSSTNQVFFNGRRWVLTTGLHDLLKKEEFHAYWSARSKSYTVEFYSADVKVDSPADSTAPDGLVWYRPKVLQKNQYVQGVDLTSEAPFRFLCATCSEDTNPCLFEGICNQDKTCECTTGSSGRLCQIVPIENGRCDQRFNSREFSYDGGDCCKQTCVSTLDHECGRDIVTNSKGEQSTVFVGFGNCKDPDVARAVSGSSTIYDIQQRGVLNCGALFTSSWFYNFMTDQCRAIAAVVLNNPDAIQMFNFTNDRFSGVVQKRFDIAFWTDYTASRDIYEISSRSSFNFATLPYYFSGFVVAGIAPFAKCADDNEFFKDQCRDIKLCLVGGTTWFDAASKVFPSEKIITYANFESTVVGLENGECNLIGGSQLDVELLSIQPLGYTGDASNYEVGSRVYFKSFESTITRPDDRVWSRFTSWIFESLVEAEESNITQATSDQMASTDAFEEEFSTMFQKAVAAVGNYGEMWDRNLPFPRTGMNLINNGTSGALISYELGRVDDEGPSPFGSSAIRTIIARDSFRCGVATGSAGFANYAGDTDTWSGFDVDLCRGITAAIFDGDDSKLEMIVITVVNRFSKIESGEVDVVPGATRTLEREVNFGVNGDAFDFSPVYFHDGMIFAGEKPHAICAENHVFTDIEAFDLNCTGTMICVPDSSTWLDALVNNLKIPDENLRVATNYPESVQAHVAGECNVIVGETGLLNIVSLRAAGYTVTDNYYFGTRKFTKEPLGMMHRSDDPQYSDFIRWIMYGFLYAEEQGITKADAIRMPDTNLFGPDFKRMWKNSIGKVGNYGQIYDRNLGVVIPRSGRNFLNDLSGPLLVAAPGTV